MNPNPCAPARGKPAFSLVELLSVIAILMILMAAGASLMANSAGYSRKTAADLLGALLEQARTTAIASRCHMVLAVAPPDDPAARGGQCRLGLFQLALWPQSHEDAVTGVLVQRWHGLDPGIVLMDGEVDGVANPMDGPMVTLAYGKDKPITVRAHVLVIDPQGGVCYPIGPTPVVMRIAEGFYQGGKPMAVRRGEGGRIAENRIQIGRVSARSYRSER